VVVLLGNQPPQGGLEGADIQWLQALHHFLLVQASLGNQTRDQGLAFLGNAYQRNAAVHIVGHATQQALFFQPVQQAGDGGLFGGGNTSQMANTDFARTRQGGQDTPLGNGQTVAQHHFMEFGRDQLAGLGQQGGQVVFDK